MLSLQSHRHCLGRKGVEGASLPWEVSRVAGVSSAAQHRMFNTETGSVREGCCHAGRGRKSLLLVESLFFCLLMKRR